VSLPRRARRQRPSLFLLLLVFLLGGVLGQAVRQLPFAPSPRLVLAASRRSGRHATQLPPTALIDVAPQDQFPGLPNGCEVTSLSMLLSAVGHPVSRFVLAADMPRDPTPRVLGPNGTILSFVGHVRDLYDGYGIYHRPLLTLLDRVLPGQGVDLTGHPFTDILRYVAAGRPVEVWTTITFHPTNQWITWQSPEGPVRATLLEHAVLVVGYDRNQLFVNNPYNGEQAEPIALAPFLASWRQLGSQAITVALRPAR
jgi:uncharacterized protein YvpB